MKIKGKSISPPKPVTVPIPRPGEGDDDIIFQCGPVLDFKEFDAICPAPKPPVIMRPGKPNELDEEDKTYLRNLDIYANRKTAWMVLKSLESTDGLEWDDVDINNPETWDNFRDELEEALTPREADLVINGVFDANIPSEARQDEALKRFMLSQAEEAEALTSQKEEPASTPSGGPAND